MKKHFEGQPDLHSHMKPMPVERLSAVHRGSKPERRQRQQLNVET